jgi:hypothetical protein
MPKRQQDELLGNFFHTPISSPKQFDHGTTDA